MKILIPTRGRPHDQPMYETLEQAGLNPTLVCNAHEDSSGRRHIVFPHDNVGEVRQHILEEYGTFIMCDDDMRIHTRKEDGMFRRADTVEIRYLFQDILPMYMKDYPLVGIQPRFMGQHSPRTLHLNKKCAAVVGFNSNFFEPMAGFDFKMPKYRLPNSEDADFQLQIMTQGMDTAVLTEWACDDKGKYRPGGCSHYRPHQDCSVEQDSAQEMLRLWPELVTITAKGQLRIAWKKASDGRRKAISLLD